MLIAAIIIVPLLFLTPNGAHAPEFILFIAIAASVFVFVEYYALFPSILEFRDAPPLNRLRFVAFAAITVSLTLVAKHDVTPSETTQVLADLGARIGQALDFPYSPVRSLVLMLPTDVPASLSDNVRMAGGMAYVICLIAVILFFLAIRVKRWPSKRGAFNVWINLPLFDPTTGGDVVGRLYGEARLNVIFGALLPFVIPAVVKLVSERLDPISLSDPHMLIWTICAWAFLPASMIMRGIALARIAALIEDQRRRACATAEGAQTA